MRRPLRLLVLHGTAALVFRREGYRHLDLRGRRLELLTVLVRRGAWSYDRGVALVDLGKEIWHRDDKDVVGTVRAEVSRLRAALPAGALPLAKKDVVWLDSGLVFSDWWRVCMKREEGNAQSDAYLASHSFYDAERAFVESRRAIVIHCPEVLERAKTNPSQFLRDGVEARWENRRDILQALLDVGHVDRAEAELMIYDEAASDDEFFGSSPDAQLDALGKLLVSEKIGQTLRERVDERKRSDVDVPHDDEREAMRTLLVQALDQREEARGIHRGGRKWTRRLEWCHVDELVSLLLAELGGFDPHVVVGVGRDGSTVATMLSHALECRLQGWIAVSRYQPVGARRSASYVRDAELPLVRASRVLVVDDLLFSGKSTRAAIERLNEKYPEAAGRMCVAALLRDSGHQGQERPLDGEKWCAGLDYDLTDLWVEFPWEKSRRSRRAEGS